MVRPVLILATAAVLSAWASAQTASAPTRADRLRLLASNRVLLEQLIDHGLKLSDDAPPLDRAAECERAAATLSRAIAAACQDIPGDAERAKQTADRVAELSDYLTAVLADGVRAALAQARPGIPEGSQDYPRLKGTEDAAAGTARQAADAIPADGWFADLPQVRAARAKLNAAAK